MSNINEEITRIEEAKSNIRNAINAQGGNVGENDKINVYADHIMNLNVGGGITSITGDTPILDTSLVKYDPNWQVNATAGSIDDISPTTVGPFKYNNSGNQWGTIGVDEMASWFTNYFAGKDQLPNMNNYYTKTQVDNQFVNKSSTGTEKMMAHFQLGDQTTTAFKQFATWRKCDTNVTGSKVNSASFYVNSDGTAAFFHKTMTDAGASAVADAILKFYYGGLYFAAGKDGRTTASDFKKVLVEGDVYSNTEIDNKLGDIETILDKIIGG